MSSAHDDMLFNMLKDCKNLPAFLDEIFGFLSRRTDFYQIAPNPNSPVGLPEGLAESLVRHTFLKWKPKEGPEMLQEDEVPGVIAEEEIQIVVEDDDEDQESVTKNMVEMCVADDDTPPAKTEQNKFSKSESYNGAIYGDYCWSQSIKDVDVTVLIPPDVPKNDIKVTMTTRYVRVTVKDKVLLEGDLCQKCKLSESMWSLDKRKLQIHLEKFKEMWWECLVTSEPMLDVSKLDCSRPFEELPEEAQAKIEELGWNQERKRMGLPTSDELAKQELLKKAWNVEGSPFSGPFDPSQVTFHS